MTEGHAECLISKVSEACTIRQISDVRSSTVPLDHQDHLHTSGHVESGDDDTRRCLDDSFRDFQLEAFRSSKKKLKNKTQPFFPPFCASLSHPQLSYQRSYTRKVTDWGDQLL